MIESEKETNVKILDIKVLPANNNIDKDCFYIMMYMTTNSTDLVHPRLKVPKKELPEVLDSLFAVLDNVVDGSRYPRFKECYARVTFNEFYYLRVIRHIVDDEKYFNTTKYTFEEEL